MVQIRDIFGEVIDTSPKRSRTRIQSKPVTITSAQTNPAPVSTTSDDIITRLISKSKNRMFTDTKKDYSIIYRRILKIETDKNRILKKTEHLLDTLPYLSVCQAINFAHGKEVWVEWD